MSIRAWSQILFACLTFPNQQTTLNGSATLGFWATRRPRAALRGAWSRLTPRHTQRGPRPPSLGTSGTANPVHAPPPCHASWSLEPPDAASHAAWASAAVTRHFWDWMTAHPRDPGLQGHAPPPCGAPWSLEPPDAASHAAWASAAVTRHFWDWMTAHPILFTCLTFPNQQTTLNGSATLGFWATRRPRAALRGAWSRLTPRDTPPNDVKWQRDHGLLGHAPPPCHASWSLEPPDAASHAASHATWASAAVTRHFWDWMTAHPILFACLTFPNQQTTLNGSATLGFWATRRPRAALRGAWSRLTPRHTPPNDVKWQSDPGLLGHALPPCRAPWSLEPPDAASHTAWASAAVTRHFWDWMTAHPRDPGLLGHAPPPCRALWSLEPPDAASHAAWSSAAVTRHFWMTAHPILFTCLTFPNQQTTLNGSATLGYCATRRPRATLRGAWSRLTPRHTPRHTPPNDFKWQRDPGLLGHAPPPCRALWSLEPPDAASHAAWASAAVTRHFWDWMTAHPILFACLAFPNHQTTLNGSATLGFWATRRPRAALRGAWSRLTPRHTLRGPRPPSLGTSGTG
ncbi:foot protein 1 variant 1-like [Schistocerca nitens]|uniref:foot protein 1 variant 1-like n=1 Tax=Schistocerca nitens TaxID=7011 RepID=UPI002119409A|nr:foot protein 1 variant 1-like [Schistocerca nitens]